MADDILKEFQEFLEAKRQSDADEQSSEDFEVEIWDEKGRGVRTRRSHAKPFLNSLGIDLPEPDESSEGSDSGSGNDAGKGDKKKSGPTRSAPTGSGSTVRKYFTKAPAK